MSRPRSTFCSIAFFITLLSCFSTWAVADSSNTATTSPAALGSQKEIVATLISIAGLAGGIFKWVHQYITASLRGKIKADLEILEKVRSLFGNEHSITKRTELHTVALLQLQYSADPAKSAPHVSLPDLFLGVVLFMGAGWWLWYSASGPWLRYVAAAALMFVGIGAFLNAFNRKALQRSAA